MAAAGRLQCAGRSPRRIGAAVCRSGCGLIFPIVDSPRDPAHRPWVTLALILANVAVGAATLPLAFVPWVPEAPVPGIPPSMMGHLDRLNEVVFTWGFRPSEPSLLTTASAMFLHGGFLHLAGNMLFLWVYGPNVERRLGRVPFVLLYLTAGILGTLLYALTSLGSPIPAIGASGAISGVLGAYLVFHPLNTIRMWLYIRSYEVPAYLVLVFFLVVDNLVPFVLHTGGSVAHAAHLGGFFAGMMLAFGLRLLHPAGDRPRRPKADPLARPQQLVRQGMLLDAHRALVALVASPKPDVAAAARRELDQLEADPTFRRVAQRGGHEWNEAP